MKDQLERRIGNSIGLGVAMGVALGAASQNWAIGMPIGLVTRMLMAGGNGHSRPDSDETES
jgi:hypothetical protein